MSIGKKTSVDTEPPDLQKQLSKHSRSTFDDAHSAQAPKRCILRHISTKTGRSALDNSSPNAGFIYQDRRGSLKKFHLKER